MRFDVRNVRIPNYFYKMSGIAADDEPSFDLSPFFEPTADFIDDAIKGGGVVYVHCLFGISRSTTIGNQQHGSGLPQVWRYVHRIPVEK